MGHGVAAWLGWSLVLAVLGGEAPGAMAFRAAPAARFSFGGVVGERIERSIDGWLLPAPLANPGMLEMFRSRDRSPPPSLVPWAGEFVGKYLLSAILTLPQTSRPELAALVERVVGEFLRTQAEDGYLGPFPRRERLLGHWDLWGHYHVIQALLLWHERTGSEPALAAARRAADLIARTYLDSGRRVLDAGSPEMNMAVIHALGMLHRKTGEESYLRLMREIEKDWERSGDYFRQGLSGVDFFRTPRPRWESLHDVQGLVELYRITGDGRYRRAFENLWWSIARRDRHSSGGFSSGEQAVGHPWSPAAIETCCTVAWVALSADMLRLSGEAAAADELELSTLNAVLGAQHPSGRWWTYNTPMDGAREASAHTIVFQARAGTPELNCCSVNGPRGLAMLSEWAVLLAPDGPVVSYYGPLKASLELADGTGLTIEEETGYPWAESRVRLTLHPSRPARFTLRLRVPGWSRETRVSGPEGEELRPAPGSYLALSREWRDGERLQIDLDQRLRVWAGDRGLSNRISVFRGPVLLAYDQRLNPFDEDALPVLDASAIAGSSPDPLPVGVGPLAPHLLVRLPGAGGEALTLCDFASAGAAGTRYRSWLPARNAPPPPVLLEEPAPFGAVPRGRALFSWKRSRAVEEYRVLVSPSAADFSRPLVEASSRGRQAVLDLGSAAGELFFKVVARSPGGATESEARPFRVDPGLPPLGEPPADPPGPGPDLLLLSAPLRGEPRPSRGVLLDAAGVEPAPGPSGAPAGALAFDGVRGRARYALAFFPERDYTVLVRVAPRSLPTGRLAQVFSAWAGAMDDPLRLTIEGGKLFARLEAERSFSTEGVPVEAGRWIHLAAVKSGSSLSLYVDGRLRASVQVPGEVYSEAVSVALGGNPSFGGNEFLPASMADFALHARALSAGEVLVLAR